MDDSVFRAWFGMPRLALIESLRRLADDLEDVEQCVEARHPAVSINTWALAQRTVPCLVGRPVGHPVVRNGRAVGSSELFYLDPERGIARTLSRWYRLGTRVDPEYWNERVRGRS